MEPSAAPDRTVSLELNGALDLRRTLGTGYGSFDPTTRQDRGSDGMWRGLRTAAGPVTLHVCSELEGGTTRVHVEAWGPGSDAIVERVPDLLGFHDDPKALTAHHRVVREAQRRHPGLRLGRGRALVEVLVPTILGQRVTTEEAHESWRRMVFALGERAPGVPKLRVPPSAEAIRQKPWFALSELGIDRHRAETVLRACQLAHHFERVEAMPPVEALRFLEKIQGIGRWTSAAVVATVHGFADAVPIGDYHMPHAVCHALAGEARGSDARMLELLAPYKGQRWRVIRLIGAAGIGAPRRGPRRGAWQTQVDLATRRRAR